MPIESTTEHEVSPKDSAAIPVDAAIVFYQLPFRLSFTEAGQLKDTGAWQEVDLSDSYGIGQRTYFHTFCGQPIFGDGCGEGSEFLTLNRPDCEGAELCLDLIQIANGCFELTRFHAKLEAVELRTTNGTCKNFLGLSVMTIAVRYSGVSKWHAATLEALLEHDPSQSSAQTLSLADTQLLLEYARRFMCRRWPEQNAVPDDVLFRIWRKTLRSWEASQVPDREALLPKGRQVAAVLPWIASLLAPFDWSRSEDPSADGGARHFGDERAIMFSVIRLASEEGKEREALQAVSDGNMFRLAEADGPGPDDFNYSPDFLYPMKDAIFYDRHAPHAKTSSMRTTRYLFTESHFCALVSGSFPIELMVNLYYRHMQFMLLFELAALLMFSQRVTCLVRQTRAIGEGFQKEIRQIRQDFLTFTHVHHSTNVSSQIQPREMYAKMLAATGVSDFYDEVDAEIRNATDYAIAQSSLREAETANNLQDILSVGVAISVVTGILGMNVVVGQGPWTYGDTTYDDWGVVFFLSGVVGLVAWIARRILRRRSGAVPEPAARSSVDWLFGGSVLSMVAALALLTIASRVT